MKKLIILSVLASILLAACTLNSAIPATETVSTVVADVLPPDVAGAIKNQISQTIGVTVDQIQFETVEKREWQDSCLGLGGANESCAQVITPGWLVAFKINDTNYRYRVNETGTIIRQEP